MRTSFRFAKFACLPLLAATTAFAFNSSTYTWTRSKVEFHHSPNEACLLKFVNAYQPGGEHQPVHVSMKNDGPKRLAYTLAMYVNGADAGTISVDNIGTETNDRDSNKRFYGDVNGSTLKVVVTSCTVRKD